MSFRFPAAWGLAILAILALLLPAALVAQAADVSSNSTEFHFGAMLNGSAITFEDDDVVESGAGGHRPGLGRFRSRAAVHRGGWVRRSPGSTHDVLDLVPGVRSQVDLVHCRQVLGCPRHVSDEA